MAILFETFSFAVVMKSPTARSTVVKILRDCGAKDIQSMDGLAHFYPYSAAHKIDWVFTTLQADTPENGLKLLKKANLHPHLRSLRVSLFLDDLELDVVDTAFEWGMVSWHPLQFTQDKLKKVFSNLFAVALKGSQFGTTKWATQQLVEYLEVQRRFEEIALLRERLLKQFPDDSENTIGLVRAYFQSGQTKNGLELLGEALALELSEAQKVMQEFKVDRKDLKLNLRLPCCLIIGGQGAHVQSMKHSLSELGVSEILFAPSAQQSFEMMKQREGKTFVLLHSELPDMDGGICLQRLRELGFHESPICVLATSSQKLDETLFSEMNVLKTLQLTEPFDPKRFALDLVKALQQDRFDHSAEVLVRRIRQAIRQNMFEKAALLHDHLLFSGHLTPGLDSYLKAEFAYRKKDYIEAKEKCLAALKTESPKQFVLDLLGRTLMHLGSYADAQKCLRAAHASSGKCLSRLCAIAETDSAQGNDEAAKATLATAS